MGDAMAFDTELGNGNDNISSNTNAVVDMVEASRDVTKLPRALVAGGVGEAASALYMVLFGSTPVFFARTSTLLCWYYGMLVATVLFGVAEAWVGFWVSHDPLRRRAVGMTVLWVSILPVLFVAAGGGFTIRK